MTITVEIAKLKPGYLEHNYKELLVWANILPDAEEATAEEVSECESEIGRLIRSYTITSQHGEMTVEVGPGRYKSAILLYYLASHRGIGFHVRQEERQIVFDYFSLEIIEDAQMNPDTKHTTVRALLCVNPKVIIRTS